VIVQPLVRPFLDVRSRHEVLALLTGDDAEGRALVQRTWNVADEDAAWTEALRQGWMEREPPERAGPPGSTPPPIPAAAPPTEGLEVVIRPDPCIHDGQFADNPWLQELPKPLTKLTWDNAIHVSP
jgi:molybdopterin-containing oxidoreductase family iron-sulfur binding subunit